MIIKLLYLLIAAHTVFVQGNRDDRKPAFNPSGPPSSMHVTSTEPSITSDKMAKHRRDAAVNMTDELCTEFRAQFTAEVTPHVAIVNPTSSDATSVPGPPERATLEVIGATTLRAVFEPPLSDSGSIDASSFEMQHSLENLGSVDSVYVSRSTADEQSGYTWEIEFLSDRTEGTYLS
jgi:hypothetical protein